MMNLQEKEVEAMKISSPGLLTGHRGIPSKAPENTLAGFRLASQNGATWIETDVQLSVDRVPVIIHDHKVNRTTNGRGFVGEMTAEHLSRLDAGSWFAEEYAGEPVPTLKETLELCLELNLCLNLELKLHPGDSIETLVDQVICVVKLADFPLDRLVFSSFSREAIECCRQIYPQARRGFITGDCNLDIETLIESCDLYSIHLNHRIATPELVTRLKEKGLMVAIWTMNDASRAEHFFDIGVDNIMSDIVDLLQPAVVA